MASLQASMRKGQIAMTCQLCENEPKMKWKCIDCGLMMCQRCYEKVHPKFPGATNHSVLDLKEIGNQGSSSGPKLDFTNIQCTNHSSQKCCLYCKKCDQLVCPTCVSEKHSMHQLIEISKGYEQKVESLRNVQQKVEKNLYLVQERKDFLAQRESLEKSIYLETKDVFENYEDRLMEAYKRERDNSRELKIEIDKGWSDFVISFKKEWNSVKEKENHLKDNVEKVNNLCQGGDVTKVFHSDDLIKDLSINISLPVSKVKRIPKFVPADFSLMTSKLVTVCEPTNADLKITREIQTTATDVGHLIECADESLWMHDTMKDSLEHVKPDNASLTTISKMNLSLVGMCLKDNGDLLISVGSPVLKVIRHGTRVVTDTKISLSPYNAGVIHLLNKNQIAVGVTEPGPAFPCKGKRMLLIINENGMKEKIFEKDNNNQNLFTYVYDIAHSKTSIAVVDQCSPEFIGRVVVLDFSGAVKTIFKGHDDINGKSPFKPRSITATLSDNFVIADYWNHMLVILNNEGDLLAFQNTGTYSLKIASPVSVVMRKKDKIYLGCAVHSSSENMAKIYELENFPW